MTNFELNSFWNLYPDQCYPALSPCSPTAPPSLSPFTNHQPDPLLFPSFPSIFPSIFPPCSLPLSFLPPTFPLLLFPSIPSYSFHVAFPVHLLLDAFPFCSKCFPFSVPLPFPAFPSWSQLPAGRR